MAALNSAYEDMAPHKICAYIYDLANAFNKFQDGKIFVYDVEQVVKIRTGEEDFAALQDVE